MRHVALSLSLLCPLAIGCAAQETRRTALPSIGTEPAMTADPRAIPAEKFEEIDRFFHRKTAQLQFTCYNPIVEKLQKKFEGHVTLSISVEPGGRAGDVRVTTSTLRSPEIEACLIAEMTRWEWPDVPATAPYTGSVNFKSAW